MARTFEDLETGTRHRLSDETGLGKRNAGVTIAVEQGNRTIHATEAMTRRDAPEEGCAIRGIAIFPKSQPPAVRQPQHEIPRQTVDYFRHPNGGPGAAGSRHPRLNDLVASPVSGILPPILAAGEPHTIFIPRGARART